MLPNSRLSWLAAISCLTLAIGMVAIAWHIGYDGRDSLANRIASEKNPQVIDYVHTTKWWVATFSAVLLFAAALSARWWAGPSGHWSLIKNHQIPKPTWRWWLAVGILIIAGAALRAERLNLSLYNDEAYSFRRYISGHERTNQQSGEKEFREAKWVDTMWHMQVGNNSPPYNLLARLAYEKVAQYQNLAVGQIHESAIRFPAFVAGLLGIFLIGLAARQLGSPDHGLVAMAIIALHPWAIQFSTTARGHSFLLVLIPLLILTCWHALRKGTWQPWIAFGATSTLLMWTFPGAIHPLIALNSFIALWFLHARFYKRDNIPTIHIQSSRWLLCNFFAAIFFLLLYAPLANQMRVVMKDGSVSSLIGGPSWSWWSNATSQLAIGMRWHDTNPASPHASAVIRSMEQGAPFLIATLILLGFLTVAGCIWWCRHHLTRGLLLITIAFATPILGFTVARLTDTVLHSWYVLSALPALIILLCGATGWLSDRRAAIAIISKGVFVATFGLWLFAISTPLQNYGRNSLHPLRDAVERVRGQAYPAYLNEAPSAKLATFWTDLSIYDPFAITTWSIEELKEVESKAKVLQIPLYVVFGHHSIAIRTRPELVAYIEQSGNYQHIEDLYAAAGDAQFNYHLFKWLNPPMATSEKK